MKRSETPILDPRNAAAIVRALLRLRPGYVPEWQPREDATSWAMLQIYGRMVQAVIERLNKAPDKNLLAFLDLLGLSLVPAQAARAPVAFKLTPNSRDGRAVAGTQLGAKSAAGSAPISFETERAIALAAAKLTNAFTLVPARDAYAPHSDALTPSKRFTLFAPLQSIPHVLYLAHDTLFALSGKARLEISFQLSPGSSGTPLPLSWEYWDGQVWQPFAGSAILDGTNGLTRSGVLSLSTASSQAQKTTINGKKAYWLRGGLTAPLPAQTPNVPRIDRIRLRSVLEQSTRTGRVAVKEGTSGPVDIMGCVSDVTPDRAVAGGSTVNLSKAFLPFDQAPRPGSAFYFASEEVLSKPGAEVTVCFHRSATPEAEAEKLGKKYEKRVEDARVALKKAAEEAGNAVVDAAQQINQIVTSAFPTLPRVSVQTLQRAIGYLNGTVTPVPATLVTTADLIDNVHTEAQNVITALINAAPFLDTSMPPGAGGSWQVAFQIARNETFNAALAAAQKAQTVLDQLRKLGPASAAAAGGAPPPSLATPRLLWEYWDGSRWKVLLGPVDHKPTNFLDSSNAVIKFTVPSDLKATKVNGVKARWIRVRLASGSYDHLRWISWHDKPSDHTNFIPIIESRPPVLESLYLGYLYRSPRVAPEQCLSYNDFQYVDHRAQARWSGNPFPPFRPVADRTPALYLGFDKLLPADLISLYFDIEEDEHRTAGPPLVWEQWDGRSWVELVVTDETAHLTRPGMLTFIAQPSVLLSRFGASCSWVRGRLKEAGTPLNVPIRGVHLNATWAVQRQTLRNEVLGSGTGQPDHVVFFRQTPVLVGEQVEVRELSGRRAKTELAILTNELHQQGLGTDHIRTVTDSRSGDIEEVWVRWQARPHLYFSGPDDRHYVVERARGRLVFGDGVQGMIPPAGSNNILARRYQSGGGWVGNVPAGAITQLLSLAPPAHGVKNLCAAEGGADGEPVAAVRWRGPQRLRHRGRAVTVQDYEALVREASPGVAVTHVLPTTDAHIRYAPGWVTVILIPHIPDKQPQPSLTLKRRVKRFLEARAPAGIAGIYVTGPKYFPVGVTVTVAVVDLEQAGPVERRVRAALARFLHPVDGGPDGAGWPFGRSVYTSDVAAMLEAIEGVDYLEMLHLTLAGAYQGHEVPVPAGRVVAEGPLSIRLRPSTTCTR